MSYGTVLTIERAVRDVALHMVQRIGVQRLQSLSQRPRSLSVEGVYTVGKHEVHIVEHGGLSVLACILALRVSTLRNN